MPLLNDFLLGADPEFIIINNGHMQAYINPVERYAPWGIDHSGWVIEPHPKPELSVRALISNLHVSLNDFATVAPAGKWRAGAYFHCPERNITMGGHVHIDKPAASQDQVLAMDKFTEHMEALDLLPSEECATRRGGIATTNYQLMPGDRIYIQADSLIAVGQLPGKTLRPVGESLRGCSNA